MNQRAFPILIFLILAAAMLTQCASSQPEERNTTITGAADDGTPNSMFFDAACSGSVDAMDSAMRHGANVNAKNAFGWSPLMIAVFYDQERSVRWLIKHGADVNAVSDTGVTALLEAARIGDDVILDDLIDVGSDIHAVDQSGRSALMLAVESPRGGSVMHDLLGRGLAPDLRDADGQTALMDAASGANVQSAAILLKGGANLHAQDHAGRTPLDFAEMAHDEPMINFLASH